MFFPSTRPADPEGEALRALHRAMNTPVVAIEQLPVGPASAAVALHADSGQGVRLTIAIRSVRSGQTLFFTPNDELLELGSPSVALDAALSFAESMGFLFDDDEVGSRGVRGPLEAARLWREFIDEASEADLPISIEEARQAGSSRAAPAAPASRPREGEPLWLSDKPAPPAPEPAPEPERAPEKSESPLGSEARPVPRTRPPKRAPAEGPLRAVLDESSVERLYASPPPKPRLTKFREAPLARGRSAARTPARAVAAAAPQSGAETRPPAPEEKPQVGAPDLRIRLLSRF
jgi:hypothetical protein